LVVLAGMTIAVAGPADTPPKPATVESVLTATKSGALAFRLTTPEDFRGIVGQEIRSRKERSGERELLTLELPGAEAVFQRFQGDFERAALPFTLWSMTVEGREVDLGQERPLVLRTELDLKVLDAFFGAASVAGKAGPARAPGAAEGAGF
jgi:hypothetical protein